MQSRQSSAVHRLAGIQARCLSHRLNAASSMLSQQQMNLVCLNSRMFFGNNKKEKQDASQAEEPTKTEQAKKEEKKEQEKAQQEQPEAKK